MFENRVVRRIFGLKKDKIIECCRKIHNDELHNSSPNIIRRFK
jgi:hypothetical protein